jgi:hypothetical protein
VFTTSSTATTTTTTTRSFPTDPVATGSSNNPKNTKNSTGILTRKFLPAQPRPIVTATHTPLQTLRERRIATTFETLKASRQTTAEAISATSKDGATVLKNLKDTISYVSNQDINKTLKEIHDHYNGPKKNDANFYLTRLAKQKNTALDILFIQGILDSLGDRPLENGGNYEALFNIASMMLTKYLCVNGANPPIYDKIYKLVEYLAEHEVFYAVKMVLYTTKYVKDNPTVIAEKNTDQISEKLYDIIKSSIKIKLANNVYCSGEQEFIAKKIPEILQQLTTPENKALLINEWLEDKKLPEDFKKMLHTELQNIEFIDIKKTKITERLKSVFRCVAPNSSDSVKTKDKKQREFLATTNTSVDIKKFKTFMNQEPPLNKFINYLQSLRVNALIDLLSQEFNDYNRNVKNNFFTALFAEKNSILYEGFISRILVKIDTKNLSDDDYELITNIAFSMHMDVLGTDKISIVTHDSIFYLMKRVCDNNVKYPIKFLRQIIENKQQYKFKFIYSVSYHNVVCSGFLGLLTQIFTKQQDAETYKLYEDIKDDIADNIRRKSGSSLGQMKYVADFIFNIGNILKDKEEQNKFFEYWLNKDANISKKFQTHLLKLLHKNDYDLLSIE